MDTSAYDKNLPCLNPHCKSHGKPHPNCRCYGLAKGGEVSHFCQSGNSHNLECEYYLAEGGEAIDPSKVVLDGNEPIDPSQVKVNNEPINPKEVVLDKDEPIDPNKVKLDGSQETKEYPTLSPLEGIKEIGKTAFSSSLIGKLSGYKHETHPQVKAGLESVADAYLPGAKFLESKLLGEDPKEIKKREEEYPYTEGIGKVVGTAASYAAGPLKLIGMAAGTIPAVKAMSQIGASVISNIVQNEAQVTSNDISKYLLGGSPEGASDAVGAWALHSLMAIPTGIAGGALSQYLGKAPSYISEKTTKQAEEFLLELGSDPVSAGSLAKGLGFMAAGAAGAHAVYSPSPLGGITEFALTGPGTAIGSFLAKNIFKWPAKQVNGILENIASYALGMNSPEGINRAAQFGTSIYHGLNAAMPAIESAVKAGATTFVPYATDKQKEYFKNDIERGGALTDIKDGMSSGGTSLGESKFAKGGEIKQQQEPNHFANLYPEANALMGVMKGRVYSYMNSIRPSKEPVLMFDNPPAIKQKSRTYDKAVEIAINPLSVMNSVNKGNLTPDDMKHLTSMHPEAYGFLSKKITEHIMKSKLKGEKPPPFTKRKSLSLFLGSDLDSSLTQQSIQAVQGVYAMGKAAQQPMQKNKKSTSTLSKDAPSHLTGEQARAQRQQNQKV